MLESLQSSPVWGGVNSTTAAFVLLVSPPDSGFCLNLEIYQQWKSGRLRYCWTPVGGEVVLWGLLPVWSASWRPREYQSNFLKTPLKLDEETCLCCKQERAMKDEFQVQGEGTATKTQNSSNLAQGWERIRNTPANKAEEEARQEKKNRPGNKCERDWRS